MKKERTLKINHCIWQWSQCHIWGDSNDLLHSAWLGVAVTVRTSQEGGCLQEGDVHWEK